MSTGSPFDASDRGFFSRLNGPAWATLVVGLVGFVLHLTVSSSSSVNGAVSSCSSTDFGKFLVAVIGWATAVACLRSRRGEDPATARVLLIAAAVGFVLADVHLVWGVLHAASVVGPCS